MSGALSRRRDRTNRPLRVDHYSAAVNNLPKFLEYLEVESIEDLPSAKFGKAKQALATKRAKLAEETAPAEDAPAEPHELLGAG